MLLQLLANGLVTSCAYALIALGFSLIYGTTRIFHFAHGAIYTLAVYIFFTFFSLCKWPMVPAIVLTVIFISISGIFIDEFIYRPFIRRGSSLLILMLCSLGLYIIIVNIIAMIYGNDTKLLSPGIQSTFSFGSVILTKIQVITAIASIFVFTSILFVLKINKFGKLVRAMRDDPILVSVMGINLRHVRWVVFPGNSGGLFL